MSQQKWHAKEPSMIMVMTVEYISKFAVFDFEWITPVKERGIANKQKIVRNQCIFNWTGDESNGFIDLNLWLNRATFDLKILFCECNSSKISWVIGYYNYQTPINTSNWICRRMENNKTKQNNNINKKLFNSKDFGKWSSSYF